MCVCVRAATFKDKAVEDKAVAVCVAVRVAVCVAVFVADDVPQMSR